MDPLAVVRVRSQIERRKAVSRAGAAESSPGRKPGVEFSIFIAEPRSGDRPHVGPKNTQGQSYNVCGPRRGLVIFLAIDRRAYARGYFLPPLRGSLRTIIEPLRNQHNKTGAKAHPSCWERGRLVRTACAAHSISWACRKTFRAARSMRTGH